MGNHDSARVELRQAINEQIRETEEVITALEAATQPVGPDNAIGRLSRMEALTAKGINEEALRMARDRRIKLDDALQRVEEPGFGICSRCASAIAIERLLLVPDSRICVSCKQALTR